MNFAREEAPPTEPCSSEFSGTFKDATRQVLSRKRSFHIYLCHYLSLQAIAAIILSRLHQSQFLRPVFASLDGSGRRCQDSIHSIIASDKVLDIPSRRRGFAYRSRIRRRFSPFLLLFLRFRERSAVPRPQPRTLRFPISCRRRRYFRRRGHRRRSRCLESSSREETDRGRRSHIRGAEIEKRSERIGILLSRSSHSDFLSFDTFPDRRKSR